MGARRSSETFDPHRIRSHPPPTTPSPPSVSHRDRNPTDGAGQFRSRGLTGRCGHDGFEFDGPAASPSTNTGAKYCRGTWGGDRKVVDDELRLAYTDYAARSHPFAAQSTGREDNSPTAHTAINVTWRIHTADGDDREASTRSRRAKMPSESGTVR